ENPCGVSWFYAYAQRSRGPGAARSVLNRNAVVRAQTMIDPPSTAKCWPVMCRDASLARNTTGPLRSSSPPRRCNGVRDTIVSSSLSSSPADIFDGKKPGQIALTLMLYLPHSAASARVKLIAAAFDVLYAIVFMPGGEPLSP